MRFKTMYFTKRAKVLIKQFGFKTALFFAMDERDWTDIDEHPYRREYWENVIVEINKNKK